MVIQKAEKLLTLSAEVIRESDLVSPLSLVLFDDQSRNDILTIYTRPRTNGIADLVCLSTETG